MLDRHHPGAGLLTTAISGPIPLCLQVPYGYRRPRPTGAAEDARALCFGKRKAILRFAFSPLPFQGLRCWAQFPVQATQWNSESMSPLYRFKWVR